MKRFVRSTCYGLNNLENRTVQDVSLLPVTPAASFGVKTTEESFRGAGISCAFKEFASVTTFCCCDLFYEQKLINLIFPTHTNMVFTDSFCSCKLIIPLPVVESLSLFFKKNIFMLFIFGCARSSLLHGLFSSCRSGGVP